MAKTDAEWLAESAHYEHITYIKLSILGQLALKEVAPLVVEPIKEEK